MIITLGYSAAKHSLNFPEDTPVIHSYLTEFQYHQHTHNKNHYVVLLEQPFSRYINFIKLLLPVEQVAIIKTDNNKINPKQIQQIEHSLKLKVNQHIFKTGDNPVNTVRNLLTDNDVLLTLPEPDVYNNRSLKGILLSSYRLNKPVISYSPAHVKSGALAAIYTSPVDIGRQLGRLVNQILKNKSLPTNKLIFASDFNIIVNQQVTQSLGLKLPDSKVILDKLRQNK